MPPLRDNFSAPTKRLLADQVGNRCSYPKCRTLTKGPDSTGGTVNVGVAAHICAASPGGPRYDPTMTPEMRSGPDNGIWLCQKHAKLIDSDTKYTVELLHAWRRSSVEATVREVQTGKIVIPAEVAPMLEDMDGNAIVLAQPAAEPALPARIHEASVADVAKYKRRDTWPKYAVTLGLRAEDSSGNYHITDLASTIRTIGHVALISAPGTGKSTTLIQAAESILMDPQEVVAFVWLGNWAKGGLGLIEAVISNPAFDGITPRDILNRANENRLTLILDGWNELDKVARDRAVAEINDLKLNYPLLRIVISTRRQATELPITGMSIDLQELSDDQQIEIAKSVAGEDGIKVVDTAWRTKGVRDLVSIPLYLNALVTNAPGGVLPTTKEEVLRLFIEGQERKRPHVDVLRDVLEGNHRPILIQLGAAATASGNTYISDSNAKAIVSKIEKKLNETGQFSINVPSPMVVLDTLVNHDILVRYPDNSVGFQHQQLQEWHASFDVAEAMLAAIADDRDASAKLVGMLNDAMWEEPILFACERLSRAGRREQNAVANAITLTIGIDPMLAADMIFRSHEDVWRSVEAEVTAFVGRWHQAGRIDRAIRFVIMTGRQEFAELVWPFIETSDNQSYVRVLRHAPRFRPSVLGEEREQRLTALPTEVRRHVLSEIAANSEMDGMELASKLAKADADVEVQHSVVVSLMFRRGTRLASDILRTGLAEVCERIALNRWGLSLLDQDVADRIRQMQVEMTKKETDKPKLLSMIVEPRDESPPRDDVDNAVFELIADPAFPANDDYAVPSIGQAFEQYPEAVRAALLERFRAGTPLSFHCYDMMRGGEPIDTGPISEMALSKTRHDHQADIAASLVGDATALRMLDRLIDLFDAGQRIEWNAESEERIEFWAIERRMNVVPEAALAYAWLRRSQDAEPKYYAFMADLLATHGRDADQNRTFILDEAYRREISGVLRNWAEVLIADESAMRGTLAKVAIAIARLGFHEDIDVVERLLDEDLVRQEKQRAVFVASGGRSNPTNEASMHYGNIYRTAFSHLKSEASSKVLEKYLTVSAIANDAAFAMKDIQDKPVTAKEWSWRGHELDGAEINDRRRGIAEGRPKEESREASAIFAAVDRLTEKGSTEEQHRIALQIACAATYMPHDRRHEIIERLLSLSVPWGAKYRYMRALAFAGETLRAEHINNAVAEYYELAKTRTYMLDSGSAHYLHRWLRLFPFSDQPRDLLEVWNKLPDHLKDRHELEGIVRPLGAIGHPHAEDILFLLADKNPVLIGNYVWVDTVLKLGTDTAVIKLLEMSDADARVIGAHGGYAHERQLEAILAHSPALRATLLARYKDGEFRRSGGTVEKALAACADADTLLTMVEVKGQKGATLCRDLNDALKAVVLEQRPLGSNSYEVYGVNAAELRKTLFAMIDGPSGELAKACLTRIDELRDKYGRVEFEPRHPNIETDRPWPLEAKAN